MTLLHVVCLSAHQCEMNTLSSQICSALAVCRFAHCHIDERNPGKGYPTCCVAITVLGDGPFGCHPGRNRNCFKDELCGGRGYVQLFSTSDEDCRSITKQSSPLSKYRNSSPLLRHTSSSATLMIGLARRCVDVWGLISERRPMRGLSPEPMKYECKPS